VSGLRKGLRNGLLLGAIQIAIVLSLCGKLIYDRSTRPRVWVLCQVYDPDLPIRGRYLGQRLQMPAEGFTYKEPANKESDWYPNQQWAYFNIREGQLFAEQQGSGAGEWVIIRKTKDGIAAISEEPVAVFIPDTASAPVLKPGEELWVEVTVPAKGPPRPIRIGVKKDGVITPLQFN
jgi:hypothetical protein